MKQLKIGIVEDELLIAESISVTLRNIGYYPVNPVRNFEHALKMIETESPDLLLLDISIDGKQDGIDLGMKVNKDYGIPFIFLTSYSDPATVNRAKKANPYAYLVKPFNESDLFSSIEIAFNNYNRQTKTIPPQNASSGHLKDVLFIKEGDLFHKVKIDDILYVESDNVYLNVYTPAKHYVARIKLDDFINGFAIGNFIRVHRSYAVNIRHLDAINSLSVKVAGKDIPLHQTYKQELLQLIKAIK